MPKSPSGSHRGAARHDEGREQRGTAARRRRFVDVLHERIPWSKTSDAKGIREIFPRSRRSSWSTSRGGRGAPRRARSESRRDGVRRPGRVADRDRALHGARKPRTGGPTIGYVTTRTMLSSTPPRPARSRALPRSSARSGPCSSSTTSPRGPRRFTELERSCEGISPRTLAEPRSASGPRRSSRGRATQSRAAARRGSR